MVEFVAYQSLLCLLDVGKVLFLRHDLIFNKFKLVLPALHCGQVTIAEVANGWVVNISAQEAFIFIHVLTPRIFCFFIFYVDSVKPLQTSAATSQ
jgi:hypothetical protein